MALISLQTATKTATMFLTYFSKEVKGLDSGEFRFKLHNAKRAKLIDVSTRDEFHELHIPGSVNYDMLSPEFADKLETLDRTKTYFLYCRNGSRSESAMRIMEELGFKRVYSLVSGLQSWKGTLARSF